MTSHKHEPAMALYYALQHRQSTQQLTCLHCGKPIYCTNEWISSLRMVPILLLVIALTSCPWPVLLLPAALLVFFCSPWMKRRIFALLRFEIDNDVLRSAWNRRR